MSLYRIAAFTTTPDGGNPAGVHISDALPSAPEMQLIAADVGYSETAFLAPSELGGHDIRYYSPQAEVPFCGHATIASGTVLGQLNGAGTYRLQSSVGEIPVVVSNGADGPEAELTSVTPSHQLADESLVGEASAILGWDTHDLDSEIAPAVIYGGARHLLLALRRRDILATMQYDFETLRKLMLAADLVTLQLVYRESETLFHARNPFPVGGIVEDPATGAAAAALGGYLRDAHLIDVPTQITISQGVDMGRPSLLVVTIPPSGGIRVKGSAVSLEAPNR